MPLLLLLSVLLLLLLLLLLLRLLLCEDRLMCAALPQPQVDAPLLGSRARLLSRAASPLASKLALSCLVFVASLWSKVQCVRVVCALCACIHDGLARRCPFFNELLLLLFLHILVRSLNPTQPNRDKQQQQHRKPAAHFPPSFLRPTGAPSPSWPLHHQQHPHPATPPLE